MAKTSISLVSVQKPTANAPILQRRNKFTASSEQQIVKIGMFREGACISREAFWEITPEQFSFSLVTANSRSSWKRVSQL